MVILLGLLALPGCRGGAKKAEEYIEEGNALMERQEYEKAAEQYKTALDMDPESVPATLGLADAYVKMGRAEKALDALNEAWALTGSDQLAQKIEEVTRLIEA